MLTKQGVTMEYLKNIPKITNLQITPIDTNLKFLDIAKKFSNEAGFVLLLSGGDHDCSNFNIIGIRPWLEIKTKADQIQLSINNNNFTFKSSPFTVLKQIIKHLKFNDTIDTLNSPFKYGLLGYLSYDLKDQIEDLPSLCIDDLHLPDIILYCPKYVIIQDIKTKKIYLIIPKFNTNDKNYIFDQTEILNIINLKEIETNSFYTDSKLYSNFLKNEYIDAINKIKDYIVRGHIYQVNMSQRFVCSFYGDAFEFFIELFNLNPAPFFAYINASDHKIISTSPERFLFQNQRYVETRPIKGTRPRGKTPKQDEQLLNDLKNSIKDDAELSMIVDLLRNDIGKVCEPGSVKVVEHKRVEKYQNVFHLISIVTGKLNKDADSIDLIKATFPGGSITGCPKIRAMEIIEELEPNKRHIYTGSIGYISFHNTMDLSIAIRTATLIGNKLIFSVGGGIVYDSDPILEYEETLHKGQSFLSILKKRSISKKGPFNTWVWVNGKFVQENLAQIKANLLAFQYGMGLFETIRVEKGNILFLDEHLQRLKNGWKKLLHLPFPKIDFHLIIKELISKNALRQKVSAVKIIAGKGTTNTPPYDYVFIVSAREYTPRIDFNKRWGLHVGIYPEQRYTPIANFKTLNYLYYETARKWAHEKNYEEAIILNPDGSISEGNSTNIILIKNDVAYLPYSKYFLKGIMLDKVVNFLKILGYKIIEKQIFPDEMFCMDEVILTNSLIGALSIASIDNKRLKRPDNLLSFKINEHFFKYWRNI